MLESLLLVLLSACGVPNSTTDTGDGDDPEDITIEEQHFCCSSVDAKARTGGGCFLIAKDDLRLCTTAILYCPGFYTLDGGVVECPN